VSYTLSTIRWRRFQSDLRAVAEIQKKVIKQRGRNVISRHLHVKNDKEKITTWRLDLDRILQVFNVRSVVTIWRLLTLDSQTELAINTNVIVSETHVMVSKIHRTIVEGQGGSLLVSDTFSIYRRITTHPGLDSNQVSDSNCR